MITLIRASHQVNYRINEYVGKSTDIKPRKDTPGFNIQNGDILYCMDDQTTFMYGMETDEWNVCFTMGGWTNDFNQGLFQMYGATSSWTSNNYGARLMILP